MYLVRKTRFIKRFLTVIQKTVSGYELKLRFTTMENNGFLLIRDWLLPKAIHNATYACILNTLPILSKYTQNEMNLAMKIIIYIPHKGQHALSEYENKIMKVLP